MDIPKKEQEMLAFWDRIDAFKKSVEQRPALHSFVFYDGPPFATGLPHYGHLVPGTMKDMIPRYKAMCGYRVERRWGWDCHGLPVENLIEQELGLKTKKDILSYGVDRFNEACRASVSRYVEEWKDIIRRTGRWVDMDSAYRTMDVEYMESIWWVFSELYKKGLLYEGRKPMHICPRCETSLSNFEVTLGYKDITDPAITVKFRARTTPPVPPLSKGGIGGVKGAGVKPVHLLAWTTTPWTLPGNMFLAVHQEHDYVAVEFPDEVVILARERYTNGYEKFGGEVLYPYIKGTELEGIEYEPLFPYFADRSGAFRVVAADFVTLDEGTGIVHIAPAFGEDDLRIGEREKVDIVQHVGMDGKFKDEVADFRGRFVKSADKDVIVWLKERGKLFEENTVTHSYPHCWRCETPLLNYATTSWFVEVTAIKNQLIKQNKEGINWVPEHMRDGRFGMWLEGARDWSISRQRFWGTPLPVWRSVDGDVIVVNSKRELEALSGQTITDLHKHVVDKLVIIKDGKEYHRIPDVLDCWFESGAMPYAQFATRENTKLPADFIAEGQDQTRGWFYTMHVLAVALFGKPAFRNVVVNGLVLAEDGKKMAKRLKNYPEITEVLDCYGADALRFYLMNSSVVHAENLNFSEKGVDEVYKKVILIVENVVAFWGMYSEGGEGHALRHSEVRSTEESRTHECDLTGSFAALRMTNVLDRWILARLNELIRDVTNAYEAYDLQSATRPIADFVNDLSTWFVRRSRERFKNGGDDKEQASATLAYVLWELSKVIAPVMPFLAERVYQTICHSGAPRSGAIESSGLKESVHLEDWPSADESAIDQKLLADMQTTRKIVELGLAARMEAGIKVRQPLSACRVQCAGCGDFDKQLLALVSDELNVHEVIASSISDEAIPSGSGWVVKQDAGITVALNIEITPELKSEGIARELVRQINDARKKAGLSIQDIVPIYIEVGGVVRAAAEEHRDALARQTLAMEIRFERPDGIDGIEVEVDGERVWIGVQK